MNLRTLPALLACAAWPCLSAAQTTLTYEEALARARARAPRILAAGGRIAEARGRLRGASVLLQRNPEIGFSAGRRSGPGANTTDLDVGIGQTFELGGRRSARIAGARAEVDRETATSQDTVRDLLRTAGIGFWQTVAARERMRYAQAAGEIAADLLRSMEQRLEAGDVPVLDVNVARVAAARARAQAQSAEADYLAFAGDLRILLGMSPEEPLEVAGELRAGRSYQLQDLLTAALDRPDTRALAAEIRQAEAEVRLGRGYRWPDVGLEMRYERDEGDSIAKGGLSFTLPLFSRGQEQQATGEARAARLRRELEATRLAISNEVRTAMDVYTRRSAAAVEFGRTVLPGLDENETLSRRSFEEGEMNLIELLLIRRENLEVRLLHLDQLLDAAVAAVELEARAGVLQ